MSNIVEVDMRRYKDILIEILNSFPEVQLDKYVQNYGSHFYLIIPTKRLQLWGWINF